MGEAPRAHAGSACGQIGGVWREAEGPRFRGEAAADEWCCDRGSWSEIGCEPPWESLT